MFFLNFNALTIYTEAIVRKIMEMDIRNLYYFQLQSNVIILKNVRLISSRKIQNSRNNRKKRDSEILGET